MKEYTYKMNPLKGVVALDGGTKTLNVLDISYVDVNLKSKEAIIFMRKNALNQETTIDLSLNEYLKIQDDILKFEIEIKEYR